MLPRPPTPNAAVLKRIQAQPIDYWQHVGDPLADLLATIYPIDDAETLLKLIEYEAEQEQPLCLQFLSQESATARWQEPRYKAELAAWQAYVQQFPLAVRLAWQAGGGLRLLSQARWAGAWSTAPDWSASSVTRCRSGHASTRSAASRRMPTRRRCSTG